MSKEEHWLAVEAAWQEEKQLRERYEKALLKIAYRSENLSNYEIAKIADAALHEND